MKAAVLKFGGSSFLRTDDYARVAGHIADRLQAGENKIIAVVSAMSGTTDNLKEVVLDVNKHASGSNLDAALATGEMLSACLLEAAISRLGIPVTSLNGYGLGIRTNSEFGRAAVSSADPQPLLSTLPHHDVVVVTGAQAIDQSGRLTMLGRNSSDLTAVVVAQMLGERACEIYSNVPGVYSADPYLIPGARLIPEIAYSMIAQMSRYGAKVLHWRAVEFAKQHALTIICKALASHGVVTGTIVKGNGSARAVTIANDVALVVFTSPEERDTFRTVLDQNDVSTICIEGDGGSELCILSEVEFAMRVGALARARWASVRFETAVTELDCSEMRVHFEVDYERAVSLARQIHERMYPGTADEPLRENLRHRLGSSSQLVGAAAVRSERGFRDSCPLTRREARVGLSG